MRGVAVFVSYLEGFLQGICTNFARPSDFCLLFGAVRYSGCLPIRGFIVYIKNNVSVHTVKRRIYT